MQPNGIKCYLIVEGTFEINLGRRTDMNDREIVELYFTRDEDAIAETQKKYGRLCHNIANRILCNEHDAEECVNDVYLGAWQAIPPNRPRSLCAYVARLARNIAIRRLKYRSAAKRAAEVTISLDELEDIIPSDPDLESLDDADLGRMISDFLLSQPDDVRNIFMRKYWYFDSVDEISEKFGYSESKVKSVLFRTRNKLREYLTEKGVAL